jgi:hypothetical protein
LGAQDPYWVAPFGIYCSLFRCSLDTFFSGNALQLRLFFGLSQKKNAFSIRAGCASICQKIKKSGTFKEKDEEQKINTNAEHLDFESLEKKKQFDEITNSVREKA